MNPEIKTCPSAGLNGWQQSLLGGISGLLLSLPLVDKDYYVCLWFAFVPFLWAIRSVGLLRAYCLGTLCGVVFSASAAYWIVDFLMLSKAYNLASSIIWAFVFWLYSAQLLAGLALSYVWLRKHSQMHEFIVFPLLIVAFFALFPLLFPVRLGESQSQFLTALQAIEFTGVYGLDGIIALTNILLFRGLMDVFAGPKNTRFWPYLLGVFPLIAWFSYGWVSLSHWQVSVAEADSQPMGLVQPNELPTLEKPSPYPGYSWSHPPEMAMTERLSRAGAEWVIWPEAKYKAYFDQAQVGSAFRQQVKRFGTRLIFQDIEHERRTDNRWPDNQAPGTLKYNTALMIDEQGRELGKYQKMKRIPFGEYVPLVSDVPVLKQWVEGFFGKFLNEMAKGQTHQSFHHDGLSLIPLICYEVMFPEFVASAVTAAQQDKPGRRVLLGLSSNAWFGDTQQPYQHVNASILRAVENRSTLIHVVNNGPSIVALPTGEVSFVTDFQQAGGYLVDVPIVEGDPPTLFTRYPQGFIFSVYSFLFIIFIQALLRRQN